MLDEEFFAYHEDADWCYRGKQAGFRALFVPAARVWHPDTRRRDLDSPTVTYYISRNRLLFVRKHGLGIGKIIQTVARYMVLAANWSVRPKWRRKRHQRDALIRAVTDFLRGRSGRAEWLG
jgi:GT2 family glycosyltransferase